MACFSCEERQRLLAEAAKLVAEGMDFKAAMAKVFQAGVTIKRDVENYWGPYTPWRGWNKHLKS